MLMAEDVAMSPAVERLAAACLAVVLPVPLDSHKLHRLLRGTPLPSKDELKVVRSPCGAIAKTYPMEHKRTLEAVQSEWSVPLLAKDSRLIVPWGSALLTKTASGVEFTLLQDDGGADIVDIETTHLLNHNDEPHLGRIVTLVEDVAKGLKELHAMGFIHEDIKPENLVYSQEAGYRIIDFDLASRAGCLSSRAGTATYAAPEKRLANPAFSCFGSDVWSLGFTAAVLVDPETAMVPASRRAVPELPESVCGIVWEKLRAHHGPKPVQVAASQFVRMLRDMLRLNPLERITPDEIIARALEIRSNLQESTATYRQPRWRPSLSLERLPNYETVRKALTASPKLA